MSTTRLPEIPPDQRFKWDQEQDDTFGDLVGPVPDGEWMRVADAHAYGLAVWKAAIEAAHDAVADDVMPGRSVEYRTGYCDALHTALAAIKALPLPEQGGPQ